MIRRRPCGSFSALRRHAICQKDHPYAGEACEFLVERLRMTTVGNYIVFYRPVDDGVEIARVLHGAPTGSGSSD
jgi:plasmid stabilization system protein ParE